MELHKRMAERPPHLPSSAQDQPDAPTLEPSAELQRLFGRNFKLRRLAASMTQAEVAKLTGMHPQGVAVIERGTGNVTLKTMHRLAVAVGCRVEVLLIPG